MAVNIKIINCESVMDHYVFSSNEMETHLSNRNLLNTEHEEKNNDENNHQNVTYNNDEFFKYIENYKRNIGEKGEQFVLAIERKKNTKYLNKITQISKINSSAGYDILSFDENGNEVYIEVKTTDKNEDSFYLTQNEYEFAQYCKSTGRRYLIYRVINILTNPSYFIIDNLSEDYTLETVVWKAKKIK